jgi:hypothetical protein
MEMTFDIKTMITVAGVIALIGGFYYSTQHRLGSLEDQISEIGQKIDIQSGELNQIQKQLKKGKK